MQRMLKVGLVGWRGMVGSVLMQRMMEEQDFALIDPQFFTTSQIGAAAPNVGKDTPPLQDAMSVAQLKAMDVIISCQGGDYTSEVFPKLRADGWTGHWIDAASTLRMEKDAVIVLDPVNMHVIQAAYAAGNKNWVGGNCIKRLIQSQFG
jgi:aspartate-semialdehyde dehydrogenase